MKHFFILCSFLFFACTVQAQDLYENFLDDLCTCFESVDESGDIKQKAVDCLYETFEIHMDDLFEQYDVFSVQELPSSLIRRSLKQCEASRKLAAYYFAYDLRVDPNELIFDQYIEDPVQAVSDATCACFEEDYQEFENSPSQLDKLLKSCLEKSSVIHLDAIIRKYAYAFRASENPMSTVARLVGSKLLTRLVDECEVIGKHF